MSGYYKAHLFCNGRDADHGLCSKEFTPPPEAPALPTLSKLRREAAKAGWTHVRSRVTRRLDQDYCPDHRPAEPAKERP
jgi:hypothetical protein